MVDDENLITLERKFSFYDGFKIRLRRIKFEKDIAKLYESGIIKAPVHLRNNNEKQLISIFKDNNIKKEDYVFSTWASHSHALLKGIPRQEIKEKIDLFLLCDKYSELS